MNYVKIGITESSDPSYDKSWIQKLNTVDGLVLVTKGLAQPKMVEDVLDAFKKKPMVLHCTCTGWGSTAMEPNVPDPEDTMKALEQLILKGFPARNVVFRIDPIIPTADGLAHVSKVLAMLTKLNQNLSHTKNQVTRVRVSILDNYKHVIKRFKAAGYEPLYDGCFQANMAEMQKVVQVLKMYPDFMYVSCAENKLAKLTNNWIKPQGCISEGDLALMHLYVGPDDFIENPQNRYGCHCLSCKKEILQKNHTCPHGCLYCYWKRPGE